VATTLYAKAAPVPRLIRVHMLGLRLTIDCAPRWKKGQPAHSTTGTVSTSSTQLWVRPWNQSSEWPNMASRVTTIVSGRVHQKRRRKSSSSGSPSSSVGISGSSVMPQMGQVPGWSCRIWGCMGHV
jgi:hypothetical protein